MVLEHDGVRLMLDLGRPLDSGLDDTPPDPLYPGLDWYTPELLGVVISHAHPDHYGWVSVMPRVIPLYIGAAAERILREALFFSPAGADMKVAGHLEDRRAFTVGPFRITPYLADHSAFDAYSLLVEAGGRRFFYSGDIRAHGRKPSFERVVADPPREVDVLMLEGTHIRPDPDLSPTPSVTERQLEDACAEFFKETDGMVLSAFSAQNIDRMVTMYRAAKRADRLLVLDLYGAMVARATGHPDSIPQADWDDVRVFVPQSQRVLIKRTGAFDRLEWIRDRRLFPEQLAEQRERLVMMFRGSMTGDLQRARCTEGARCAWSLWPGYLSQATSGGLLDWLQTFAIPLTILHASGHANPADLQRFARAVDATRLVPIHTSGAGRFPELFERTELHDDGEWWSV